MKRDYLPIIAILMFWIPVFLLSSAIGSMGIINFAGIFSGQVSGTTPIDSNQMLFLLLTQIPFLLFVAIAIKRTRQQD
ncbi:MAG: hypothetical protein ACTSRG_01010 [Candidatus Helarchaeota archaeon]